MSDSKVETPVQDAGAEARGWLLAAHSATLSTLDGDGYPYGSVVPFALTAAGAPILLVSRIAAHTHNMLADPRVSLLVRQPGLDGGGDPQAGWRLTLIGRAFRYEADDEALPEIEARYVCRVARARGYFEAHDFDYWGIEVERARAIGGFGRIGWLEPEVLQRPSLDDAVPRIVDHMNADHRDALLTCCRAAGVECEDAELLSVEPAGCTVAARGEQTVLVHFEFGCEIDAASAREAFVTLVHRARAES